MAKRPGANVTRVGSWERGKMPDVRGEDRIPDRELLAEGHAGPHMGQAPRGDLTHSFNQMLPQLREILIRMDEQEVENLSKGLRILVRLDAVDFVRLNSVLKFINIIYAVVRILKWTVASFMAGLAAVVLAGEQLQKVWGWATSLMKVLRP